MTTLTLSLRNTAAAPTRNHSETAPKLPAGTVESSDLLQGAKAVSITHNGAIYRLQATKLGKLILTK